MNGTSPDNGTSEGVRVVPGGRISRRALFKFTAEVVALEMFSACSSGVAAAPDPGSVGGSGGGTLVGIGGGGVAKATATTHPTDTSVPLAEMTSTDRTPVAEAEEGVEAVETHETAEERKAIVVQDGISFPEELTPELQRYYQVMNEMFGKNGTDVTIDIGLEDSVTGFPPDKMWNEIGKRTKINKYSLAVTFGYERFDDGEQGARSYALFVRKKDGTVIIIRGETTKHLTYAMAQTEIFVKLMKLGLLDVYSYVYPGTRLVEWPQTGERGVAGFLLEHAKDPDVESVISSVVDNFKANYFDEAGNPKISVSSGR